MATTLSGLVKKTAEALFHYAGGTSFLRRRFDSGVRILMYHRFRQTFRFETQCAHLKKRYHPVTLTDVAGWLRDGKPIPPRAVAVTVDDGYRDFLETAFPVLEKYQIPATVFLTTDLLDRNTWLWVDQVVHCFLASQARAVTLRITGCDQERWKLESGDQRMQAATIIKEALKKIPNEERLEVLEKLPRLLGAEIPAQPPASHAPLQWDDVRELARRGVEFGAHTRTHPILSRLSGSGQLEAEIVGSKKRIEQETGMCVEHFCYPNGTPADITPEAVEVVKASGFRTSVTGTGGVNFAGADPYALRRIAVEPDREDFTFFRHVAGYEPAGRLQRR